MTTSTDLAIETVTSAQVAMAERIVDLAGQAGGIDEVRRLAEFGWPEGRELESDSPELRAAIQSCAWCVVESVDDEHEPAGAGLGTGRANTLDMTTSTDLAIEIVRVSTLHTLSEACRSESLSDLLEIHRSVLEARLGRWDVEEEHGALTALASVVEDYLDDDATEETLIAELR